jgi:hypothetical protein
MPYEPTLNPGGGINKCAYVNQAFDFTFTVAVGDSITVNFAGNELRLPLDMVKVNSVNGLPAGINYACVPANCEFPKNSSGCAALYGTPTGPAGDYNLEINATVFFPVFPGQYNVTFPDPNIAPGEYVLRVLPDQNTPCGLVSTKETLADKVNIVATPNPTSGWLNLSMASQISGQFDFKVLDLMGKVLHQEKTLLQTGNNNLDFDGSHLPNGIYLAYLQGEAGYIAQKFTIQH